MEVCTNGKNCVLLSVLLYCYSSTLPGNASISNFFCKTKYAKLVVEAQLAHLKSLRVNVNDMVHVKVEDIAALDQYVVHAEGKK